MIKGIGSIRKRVIEPSLITFSVIGFILGRVVIFGFINPLAIGFLAVFLLKKELYPIAIFTTIGLLTRFGGIYFIMYLGSVGIIIGLNMLLLSMKIKVSKVGIGIVAAVATIIPGLLTIYMLGFFYLAVTILMSLLAFSLVFLLENGINMLSSKKRQIDSEALLSLSIIFAGIAAGVADIHIGPISLKYFVSSLIILVASKSGAASGATAGVILGFLLSVTGVAGPSFVAILSASGLVAGAMREMKFNIGKILGFLIGGLLISLYTDLEFLTFEVFLSISLSFILFAFAPSLEISYAKEQPSIHAEKLKKHLHIRLSDFASSFKSLSSVIEPLNKKQTLDQHDTSKLINDVANKICKDCPSRDKCWGVEFHNTYQMFFALLAIAEKEGHVKEIPKHLKQFCEQPKPMLYVLNNTFASYKERINIQNKLSENREMVHYNLNAFSEIIQNLAEDVSQNFKFQEWAEQKILNELDLDAVVVENKFEKFEAIISPRNLMNLENVEEKVSKILGRKMIKDDIFNLRGMKLIEKPNLRIQTGYSQKTKEDSEENGDSYSFMLTRGNYAISMLADGMGSGKKAKEESLKTLELLEQFIKAGFDKEIAIRMINSALMQNSEEDIFATIDICQIDLYTGLTEFIKLGSATTYIIREDSVFAIKNKALPIGIINEIDIEISRKRLKEGDKILMMTDGVTENGNAEREKEILELLAQSKELKHPKQLADFIMKNLSTTEVEDDMTILVSIVKPI
ncbi:MAG: SpoIIE family protein phosphatase [Defluviitaleaceae bacterium]|nr:SpoIIE family protein phosphatase [Defluviitaleaceae bacterium]